MFETTSTYSSQNLLEHELNTNKNHLKYRRWRYHPYFQFSKEFNFQNLKATATLTLANGVFFTYFFMLSSLMLSLCFRQSLSHLLICTLDIIHLSKYYHHFNILQFLYLVLLVLKRKSPEQFSHKEHEKAIFQESFIFRILKNNLVKKIVWCPFKKIVKLFVKIYENGKQIYYAASEIIKILRESYQRSITYKTLKDTPSNVSQTYLDEGPKERCTNKYFNIKTYQYKIKYIRKHTFFQVHRKWKKIKKIKNKQSLYELLMYNCNMENITVSSLASYTMNDFSTINVCSEDACNMGDNRSIMKNTKSDDGDNNDENMTLDEFDAVGSKHSITSRSSRNWELMMNIIKHNVKIHYKMLSKSVESSKNFVSTKKHLFKPKKKSKTRESYMVFNVSRLEKKIIGRNAFSEKRWFKNEYEKQIGRPPAENEEEGDSSESHLDEAADRLRNRCRGYLRERNYYDHPNIQRPPIEPVMWYLAPRSIKCVCPSGDCSCQCKGNTLLPKKRTPLTFRRDYCNMHVWLGRLFCYRFKPSGTLIPAAAAAAKAEAKFYRSERGRKILEERGPEFCISGCKKFFETNKKFAARRKDFASEIKEIKKAAQKDPDVPFPTADAGRGAGGAGEAGGAGGGTAGSGGDGAAPTAVVVPVDGNYRGIKVGSKGTYFTQTKLNSNGEFIIGKYSHLMFASLNEIVMHDVEGLRLQISEVCPQPSEPITVQKLLHIQEIKELAAQKRRSILASLYDVKQKKFTKETQYHCTEGGVLCESLAEIMRKKRLKQWASREKSFKCCLKDECCQPFFEPIPELPYEGDTKQTDILQDALNAAEQKPVSQEAGQSGDTAEDIKGDVDIKLDGIHEDIKQAKPEHPNKVDTKLKYKLIVQNAPNEAEQKPMAQEATESVFKPNDKEDNIKPNEFPKDIKQSDLQNNQIKIGFVKSDVRIQSHVKLGDKKSDDTKIVGDTFVKSTLLNRFLGFVDDIFKHLGNYTPSKDRINVVSHKHDCVKDFLSIKLLKTNDGEISLQDKKGKLVEKKIILPSPYPDVTKMSETEKKGLIKHVVIDKLISNLNCETIKQNNVQRIAKSGDNKVILQKDKSKSILNPRISKEGSRTSWRKMLLSKSDENKSIQLCETEKHESLNKTNEMIKKNSQLNNLSKKQNDAKEIIGSVSSNEQYSKTHTKSKNEDIELNVDKVVFPSSHDKVENKPPFGEIKDQNLNVRTIVTRKSEAATSISSAKMYDMSSYEVKNIRYDIEREKSNSAKDSITMENLNEYLSKKIESRVFKNEANPLSRESPSLSEKEDQKQSKDNKSLPGENKKSSKLNLNKYRFYY